MAKFPNFTAMNTHVIIMAGGIGSRFWPMSTPEFPKQFIDVMGRGMSMLQETVDRYRTICPLENIWIVTGERYVGIVRAQLPFLSDSNIIVEPCPRSTAPCIAYACWKIMQRHPDATLVVSPSDAYVNDVDEYRRVIREAMEFASKGRRIVTIGIKPTRPETGYGYIATGPLAEGETEILKVSSFREKPDLQTARKYLEEGNHVWNAGIFVWSVGTLVESIRSYAPELALKMDRMSSSFYGPDEAAVVAEIFPTCENISIDYAVMEKADYIYTLPASFGWSDVGTWGALWTLLDHDENGNAVVGDNINLYDCHGCIVHAPDSVGVVLEGLRYCVVVEREGRLLICRLSEEQRIKDFKK